MTQETRQESGPTRGPEAATLAEAQRLLTLSLNDFTRARDEHFRTLPREQADLIGDCWEQLVTKPEFRDSQWKGILERLGK